MNEIIEINENSTIYPQKLLKIKNNPKKIYAKGNLKLLNNKSVAIVGSRDCTEYGYKYANKIAEELAGKSICVVSGLAKGIDSAAHLGSMKQAGKTIAVLGSGLNKIYPEENIELYNNIIRNGGLIISEYEPNIIADGKNFPKRNRIIAGISSLTIVVEAKYRSGSTITAKYAIEQGKKVFCVPSNLGVKNGIGTNKLISKGANILININSILKEFNLEKQENVVNTIKIKKEYRKIYNILSYMPTNINSIAKSLNKPISEVAEILAIMELEDIIESTPGNNFKKKQL